MFSDMSQDVLEQYEINGIPLGPELTKEQAEAIYALGKEAIIFALLTQAKMAAERTVAINVDKRSDDPSCPSGQKPVYEKPNTSKKKKPGRPKGSQGSRRPAPDHVDRKEERRAEACPDCGGPLNRCSDIRHRYIEDIPEGIKVEVVRYAIYRDFCPSCRKHVEPTITDALPKSMIGNRLLAMSAWLHYALGTTISQILSVFNFHLHFSISSGGLISMWHRLATILSPWYEEIAKQLILTAVLHADETGWRVNGQTYWLWCFASQQETLFTIEASRASPVVLEFITDAFDGVLVSDFWGAYNILVCAKQKCLVHLLRDLKRVEQYKSTDTDWARFSKKLKRLIRDGIRLREQYESMDPQVYHRRYDRIEQRLRAIIEHNWENTEAKRLIKRLRRHEHELFTFILETDVPFDNNHGERMIRIATIMRKNSFNNRSDKGALTQSILMSIFSTLKQRGLNPIDTLVKALKIYIKTGTLPPLSQFDASCE